MDIQSKINNVDKEILRVTTEKDALVKTLTKLHKEKEKLLLDLNKNNLGDLAWVIKNPHMPGSYEAMQGFVKQFYGGEYSGIHPSGYIHDGKYNPIQKNFDFWLQAYDKDRREEFKRNLDHFIENFVPHLVATNQIESRYSDKIKPVKVIPFQFATCSAGLDYLGLDPVTNTWYHFYRQYGRDNALRVFKSWEEAFEFAYKKAQEDND